MKKNLLNFNLGWIILILVLIRPFVNFLYKIELGSIFGYTVNPMSIWGLIIIILSGLYWILERETILKYNISLWIFIFLFSLIPGIILANSIFSIINQFIRILPWILSIPVFIDYFSKHDYKNIFSKFYIMIIIILIINIVLLITGIYSTGKYGLGEFYSLQKNPHSFTYTLLFLIPFIVHKIYLDNRRLIPWLVLLIASFFLFFTFVRIGMFAFFISFLVLISLEKKKSERMKKISFFILFFFILLIFITNLSFLKYAMQDRFKDISESFLIEDYSSFGSGRIGFWKAQLELYSKGSLFELLFGYGFGNVIVFLNEMGIMVQGHNDYILLLVNTGLLSLISYILFQYKLLKYTLIYRKELLGKIGLFSLIMFFLAGFFNGVLYYQSSIYISVIIGAVIARRYKLVEYKK